MVTAASPSPLARVAVAVRTGSRHEQAGYDGAVSQTLRIAAQLSHGRASDFLTTVRLQQEGAGLACQDDRDWLVYSTTVRKEALPSVLELVAGAALQPQLFPWQVSALRPAVLAASERRSPLAALLDDLHRAAFRDSPLGRPLFANNELLAAVDVETLEEHVSRCVTGPRTQIVALGVDHEDLADFADSLTFTSSGGDGAAVPPPASSDQRQAVIGGEVRSHYGGPLTMVAVAGDGAPAGSQLGSTPVERAAQLVLESLLGVAEPVKYGRPTGLLSSLAREHDAHVRGLGCVYRDAALSGYCIVAPAENASGVVRAVHETLKSTKLDDEQVNRAKQVARSAVLEADSRAGKMMECLVEQAVSGSALVDCKQMVQAIDSVTVQHVNAARQRMLGGKLAMAARGNLTHVPYLDQL